MTKNARSISVVLAAFAAVVWSEVFAYLPGSSLDPTTIPKFVEPLLIRVKAKFDIAGLYTWHCHILSHEDNQMMRPFVVAPPCGNFAPPGLLPKKAAW